MEKEKHSLNILYVLTFIYYHDTMELVRSSLAPGRLEWNFRWIIF